MRYLYGLSVFLLVCLAGCKKSEPEPEAPAPPPPLTADEIYRDYKAALDPLFGAAAPTANFGYGAKAPILAQFKTVRGQMAPEINEPEAKDRIEKQVADYIKTAKRSEQWYTIDALLDVYKILRPDSQANTSLRKRTDLMMARPEIKCTGFATIDTDDLMAFLEITNPTTREVETFRIREGEEFYPDAEGKSTLKMIKVVGAQSAVEMEYLALPGETWEIPGPKNS
tara:strand:- start:696 stop:1373 length:678 start_codon:yes stop_codon:yes gene_type:complete